MKDGADGEVCFEIFEGLFDGHELDVVLPKSRGIAFDEIGAQQIAAFTAADFTQLAAVEREGEVGRGLLDRDVGQAPGDRSLGTSGPQLHQQLFGLCCKPRRSGGMRFGREGRAVSDFKGRHFEGEIVLWAVRWYCRYGVSYRDLEQMMGERGVSVDHSTIIRWVQKYAPEIEKRLRWQWRRPRSTSWRIDETYVKVRGRWPTSTAPSTSSGT